MILRRFMLSLLFILLCQPALAANRRTAVVDAVAKARVAVVNIRTEKIVQHGNNPFFGFGDSIFDQFFRELMPSQSYRTQALGSGVIIDAQGHILTNAHVVDKASKIYVALSENSRELEAKLIGKDTRIDLAVLKIVEPGPYPFLAPGRSDDLMLGETVIAIGNPLGLGHSITTGIVSSLKRRIQLSEQLSSVFIQTDALINPGNSGGPLINVNGELIGINTAIARQAQGIGFSIPIDTAKRVLADLIEYGRVRRGFLGLIVGAVSPAFVQSYGNGGVLVDDVLPQSPAEQAGLQAADVILAIDGIALASPAQYHSLVQTYTPGDGFEISLLRGLKEHSVKVVLSPLPEGYELSYTRRVFGFGLEQSSRGMLIDRVDNGTPADRVGLKRGDLVVKIDDVAIKTLEDFNQAMEDRLGQKPLTFTVVRDQVAYLVELP